MRQIPVALKNHLQQQATTVCRLIKITLKDGREFGMTSLDRDINYLGTDYIAANGFDSSVIATDTGMSVDNAEGKILLSAEIPGISLEMVAAGELDDAAWEMLMINWADLSMGHMVIDAGDVGEVTTQDGIIMVPELLSYAMRIRQSVGHFYSRMCRATFGSDPDGQTGCGVDAEALWLSGVVTGIGDEPYRIFADENLILDPVPNVARVRFTTGPNAGSRVYQVEGYSNVSGTIALVESVPFPIVAGHEFEIRPDCDKTPAKCTSYGNWLNFKGEPLIPVGDGASILTPQAGVAGGFQGSEVVD